MKQLGLGLNRVPPPKIDILVGSNREEMRLPANRCSSAPRYAEDPSHALHGQDTQNLRSAKSLRSGQTASPRWSSAHEHGRVRFPKADRGQRRLMAGSSRSGPQTRRRKADIRRPAEAELSSASRRTADGLFR